MSIVLEKFQKIKEGFDEERKNEDGCKIMKKVIEIVNDLGQRFTILDGGQLCEIQIKLAGYKFYLASYLADLQRISEFYKIELKEMRAKRWDEIAEIIKAEKGKVSNKEQIENAMIFETREIIDNQILYETKFYQYKLKLSAIDDILTALVQQIASKKREKEQAKLI